MNKDIKSLISYVIVLVLLILVIILNNVFWKIGKKDDITYMNSNNINYDIPYEEVWLEY